MEGRFDGGIVLERFGEEFDASETGRVGGRSPEAAKDGVDEVGVGVVGLAPDIAVDEAEAA